MKKLVIHPKDDSTAFLNKVYENLDDVTLVQGGVNKTELKEMVAEHDQIIMLGHGTPYGLMSVGQFNGALGSRQVGRPRLDGNIVDHSFAELLSEKDNSIFIWCNADLFTRHHKLKGFFSGMYISEVGEAALCGMPNTSQREVDESNDFFVKAVSEAVSETPQQMHAAIKHQYGKLAATNRVAQYNHERLYVS